MLQAWCIEVIGSEVFTVAILGYQCLHCISKTNLTKVLKATHVDGSTLRAIKIVKILQIHKCSNIQILETCAIYTQPFHGLGIAPDDAF